MSAKDALVAQMYPNGRKNRIFFTLDQELDMYV